MLHTDSFTIKQLPCWQIWICHVCVCWPAGYSYAFVFQMESILFFDKVYGMESAAVIYASKAC